jgi:hypothetical protein
VCFAKVETRGEILHLAGTIAALLWQRGLSMCGRYCSHGGKGAIPVNPLGQKGTSGGDACQPDRVLSYEIGLHEAERRTGGEIWLAAAEHEGAKIKTIFVDKAECGEITRKVGTSDVNITT